MSFFRFSLKTAFILTTLAATSLGLWLHGYRSGMSESVKHVNSNVTSEQLRLFRESVERSISKSINSTARVPG